MQYAQSQTTIPGTRKLLVPVLALALGVAGATGAYALIDNNDGSSVAPADTKVIVADPPAQPGEGVSAKNEAGVASAIGQPALSDGVTAKNEAGVASAIAKPDAGVSHSGTVSGSVVSQSQPQTKDEAATAAAIGSGTYASPDTETKDEAATAAIIVPSRGSISQTQDQANRTDPHGPSAALRKP